MDEEPNDLVASLTGDTPAPEAEKPTSEPDIDQPEKVAEPQSEAEPEAEEQSKATTLKDYAAKHSIDLKELYALELSGGQTLSQLTDRGKALDKLDVDATAHAGEVAQFRANQLTFNQQVADWAALVQAGENTPQALQRLNAHREVQAKAQQAQLLQAIPEWGDATAKIADLSRIDAFASRFGLPVGTAENITEPGVALMMRYVLTLEDNFKAALEKVEKAKVKTFKAPGKPPPSPATNSGLNAAAGALLKGLQAGR